MDQIIEWDWQATLLLNDWGGYYLDQFFLFITEKYNSLPFYLLLLFVLWKFQGSRNTVIACIFVVILIACSDQLASLFKYGFERWRPYHELGMKDQISAIGKQKGLYGFYSAHASTSMGVATFIYWILRYQSRWMVTATILWAFIVTYSRIYLGLHYLGDVLMGTSMGIILGSLFAWIYSLIKARYGTSTTIN
ncbi:MAG: phosphatase PAP2 family protein [Nonlabens sp.]